MSTDVIDRLTALRPDPLLTDAQRTTMLASILGVESTGSGATLVVATTRWQRHRRLLIGAALIGVAAAGAVLIPVLASPSSPGAATSAVAAEVHRLSVVTGRDRSVVLGPGDYWYVDETEVQTGSARDLFGDTGPDRTVTLTTRHQSWTDEDGNIWRQDSGSDQNGKDVTATWYFGAGSTGIGPDYLASLPTEPDRLLDYLRDHVSGSNSRDEAVFVAVEPILQSGVAPPELRAAAVQVLAAIDHVSVTPHTRDGAGRPAERFDFDDQAVREGVQSIFFDPDTAQVLETRTTSTGATLAEIVHRTQVTHAVPDDVRAAATRGR